MQAEQTSFLFGANAPFIEELYARYQSDPSRVDAEWRTFFEALAEDKNSVLAEVRGASWAPNGARVIDVPEAPAAANRNVKSNGAAAPAALAGKSEAEIRAAANDTAKALRDAASAAEPDAGSGLLAGASALFLAAAAAVAGNTALARLQSVQPKFVKRTYAALGL